MLVRTNTKPPIVAAMLASLIWLGRITRTNQLAGLPALRSRFLRSANRRRRQGTAFEMAFMPAKVQILSGVFALVNFSGYSGSAYDPANSHAVSSRRKTARTMD